MYAGEIVERGPAEEVTQHPAHPYTQLLVASAPDPDNLGSALRSSTYRDTTPRQASQRPQNLPSATSVGCPFSPRCPFADDRCRQEDPPLMQISATRGAACWRLDVAAPGLVSGLAEGGRTTAN
jgi:peptide/nickel transport system ATP-binding protein